MQGNKDTTDLTRSSFTSGGQKTSLSFKKTPSQGSEDQNSENHSQYRDLFEDHQREGEESYQGNEGIEDNESSISISDHEEVDDEDVDEEEDEGQALEAGDSSPEAKPFDRWKVLYAQKEKYDMKKEQLRKDRIATETDPECTFKPKLFTVNVHTPSMSSSLPIHERNRLWTEKKQAKLKETSQREHQRNLTNCTFKPSVNSSAKKIKEPERPLNQECRGANQFIKRQIVARQTKEEKEAILSNPLSRLPDYATKKDGKVTVGKYPNLLTSGQKHGENSASKKDNKSKTPLRNRKNSDQEVSFSNDNCRTEESASVKDNQVYISDVTYFDAIRKLREELHRIPLNID